MNFLIVVVEAVLWAGVIAAPSECHHWCRLLLVVEGVSLFALRPITRTRQIRVKTAGDHPQRLTSLRAAEGATRFMEMI